MADGDGLENHCGGNVTVGSNPTPSALTSKTGLDLGLCPLGSRPGLVTDRSQMQPAAAIVAGRGIYAGWILKHLPRSACGKQKGPAEDKCGAYGAARPGVSAALCLGRPARRTRSATPNVDTAPARKGSAPISKTGEG